MNVPAVPTSAALTYHQLPVGYSCSHDPVQNQRSCGCLVFRGVARSRFRELGVSGVKGLLVCCLGYVGLGLQAARFFGLWASGFSLMKFCAGRVGAHENSHIRRIQDVSCCLLKIDDSCLEEVAETASHVRSLSPDPKNTPEP